MTALVLVHGFMGGSAQWDAQISALADRFDVIAPDLPGFGTNADLPAPDRIEDYARWVLTLLQDRGIDTFHLLGHSMGGMIAQDMVRQAPERIRKLVLYGTGAVGVLPGRFETINNSKSRIEQDGADHTARRIAATWFLDRQEAPAYPPCAEIAATARSAAMKSGLDAMENWRGDNRLSEIDAETLVLWGDRDRTYSWAQVRQLWHDIPKSNLAVVPGCAHAVHLEKPSLFNALITDFL